jgi:hypothetical protein
VCSCQGCWTRYQNYAFSAFSDKKLKALVSEGYDSREVIVPSAAVPVAVCWQSTSNSPCVVGFPGNNVPAASGLGGGLYLYSSAFSARAGSTAEFIMNSGRLGGSIYAKFSNATFAGAVCYVNSSSASSGAGLYVDSTSLQFVSNCTLYGNSAVVSNGGGLHALGFGGETSIYVGNSAQLVFLSNSCARAGGGAYLSYGATFTSDGVLIFKGSCCHGIP